MFSILNAEDNTNSNNELTKTLKSGFISADFFYYELNTTVDHNTYALYSQIASVTKLYSFLVTRIFVFVLILLTSKSSNVGLFLQLAVHILGEFYFFFCVFFFL